MKAEHTQNRLAGMCETLMTWRTQELPVSHNLLATLRDNARDGILDNETSSILLKGLIQKLASQDADPSIEQQSLDLYESYKLHSRKE